MSEVAWGCRPVPRWLMSKMLPRVSGSETAQASHGSPIRERRPLGSWARAAGWRSSTATTPPPPWRCTQATRSRPARRPSWSSACTTPGWSGGCQDCWTRRASSRCACGATAMPRSGTPATPNDRRPGCRRPGCRRTDRRGHHRGAQGRGPPAHRRRPVLRPDRLRQPGRQAAQLTSLATEQGSRW
jgi:hypothetical protein